MSSLCTHTNPCKHAVYTRIKAATQFSFHFCQEFQPECLTSHFIYVKEDLFPELCVLKMLIFPSFLFQLSTFSESLEKGEKREKILECEHTICWLAKWKTAFLLPCMVSDLDFACFLAPTGTYFPCA